MKHYTASKAVNQELHRMTKDSSLNRLKVSENTVFAVLGVALFLAIVANVIFNGIPNV